MAGIYADVTIDGNRAPIRPDDLWLRMVQQPDDTWKWIFYRYSGSGDLRLAENWIVASNIGVDGKNGWSPILAVVAEGERRVLKIQDWTGGSGTKPIAGQYIGNTGLVSNIAQAVDIRGPKGDTGAIDVETGDFELFFENQTANFYENKSKFTKIANRVFIDIYIEGDFGGNLQQNKINIGKLPFPPSVLTTGALTMMYADDKLMNYRAIVEPEQDHVRIIREFDGTDAEFLADFSNDKFKIILSINYLIA